MKRLAIVLVVFDLGMAFIDLPQFKELFLACAGLAAVGAVLNHFHELDLKNRDK